MRRGDAARAMVVGLLAWLAAVPVYGVAAPAAPRSGQPAAPGHGSTASPPAAAAPAPALPLPGSEVWIAPGAAPAQQGGPSSAAGARQLQRIRQAARRLRASLAPLAGAARRQGDAAQQSALAQLDAVLGQLAAAQRLTLAAYLAALNASGEARALWAGNAASLDPGQQPALQEAEAAASDLTTAAETGFVFVADLDGGRAWTYSEGEAAPAGDAGGPVSGGPEAGDLDATTAGGAAAVDPGLRPMPIEAPGAGDETAAAGASLHAEAQTSAIDSPAPVAQLGRLTEEELVPAEPEAPSDVDRAAAGGALPLEWEDLCRPWQPRASAATASGGGICPLSSAASDPPEEPSGECCRSTVDVRRPAWPQGAAPADLPGLPASRRLAAPEEGQPAEEP
jgi:hypothetical protein